MKRLLPILALAVMMSACVDPDDPTEPTVSKFSILSDSYSAYDGYVDPETNDIWPYYAEIGVMSVEQMWWHQVATEMGWAVEKNNSFSGALVSNFDGFNAGNYYVRHSFLRRMDNLGNPDLIFILGGTNDVYRNASFGDYVYSDWTEEQLRSFRPALAYMFHELKSLYPNARLYFLLETHPSLGDITEEMRQNFIESSHHIANHYNVECIDLDIHKDWDHPDAQGQDDIVRQVLEVLGGDFNV